MLEFDHIAVACETLDQGADWLEACLGRPPGAGGKHAYYGTHNRLLGLGPDLYLEVIARDPEAPPTGRPAWFGLDHFSGPPRLANWICRSTDLGLAPDITGPAVPLSRDSLRWQITVPDDGHLPMAGAFPTLLQWAPGIVPPSRSLPDSGCRLTRWIVTHPQAEWLRATVPLADARVEFREGPPGFAAECDTPDGRRTLG